MTIITWKQGTVLRQSRAERGERLIDILRRDGYFIQAPCGGTGRCGKCRVQVKGCLSPCGEQERSVLGESVADGWRLACQVRLLGDAEVLTPSVSAVSAVKLHDAGKGSLALAVDLGTTTMDARLLQTDSGKALSRASLPNPQKSYGADVISRIACAQDDPQTITAMRTTVYEAIGLMAERMCKVCGADPRRIERCVVSGNTVMTHIFWGEDPTLLGRRPFTPVFLEDRRDTAAHLHLPFAADCTVETLPCISAFLGGDVTAGLLVCPMRDGKRNLLVDIGTNGEMVYADETGMRGCAAAAGPALEGGSIDCGCPAVPGAIRRVGWKEGEMQFFTVENADPIGLCGSGIVDAAALLLEQGVLDPSGFLDAPVTEEWEKYLSGEDGKRVCTFSPGVYLTQKDIRELQLAKAAIAAGIECLREGGAVDTLYLCGGLGGAMDPHHVCEISMLPPELEDRIVSAGNTSLTGAEMIALDPRKMEEARAAAQKVSAMNLAEYPSFQEIFAEHMEFGDE